MDLAQIKELMNAMKKAGTKKLRIKDKTGYEIELEREDEHPTVSAQASFYHHAIPPSFREYELPLAAPAREVAYKDEPVKHGLGKGATEPKDSGKYITSPMVGTFYTAASPEAAAFVKKGDKVTENTVVCIVEAMKVMNEVKAGVAGVIEEVLISNGHPVEFGAKLFKIV